MPPGPRRSHTPLAPSIALVVVAVVQALALGSPARAQSLPEAEVELLSQRVFHRPDAPLGMRIRVTNTGPAELQSFGIRVDVFDRIVTRSELHATFDGVEEVPIEGYPITFETPLAPGESRILPLDERLDRAMPFFPEVEGVYPVTVSLVDDQSLGLDSLTSHLLLYPRFVEHPLNVSVVVPIGGLPARAPGGVYFPTAGGEWPLEEALGEGWLQGMVDALEQGVAGGLRLGIAPSPRLVEEIADLADGYRKSSGRTCRRYQPRRRPPSWRRGCSVAFSDC